MATHYLEFKAWLMTWTGLEKDALHIHAALFLYILAMLLFKRTSASPLPWLFVFAIELTNEAVDVDQHSWAPGKPWQDAANDVWNTMLWPTVLLLIGRYTALFDRRAAEVPDEPDPRS